jgi:hypothetical protein
MDPRKVDELFDGELVAFERWFLARQHKAGVRATGLVGAERGVIKAYLLYATTAR